MTLNPDKFSLANRNSLWDAPDSKVKNGLIAQHFEDGG
jgi:hypothetical protein